MISHLVMFTWKDGVTPEQVAELTTAIDALHGLVPGLISIHGAPDVRLRPGNPDYLLAATFANGDAWHAYQAHPRHKALVRDMIEPMTAHRLAMQTAGNGTAP